MGRGSTQPITFSIFHSPAGPAHQLFKNLGPARSDAVHYIFKSLGPARPGPSQFSDRPGAARPGPDKRLMTSPVFVKNFDKKNRDKI